MTRSIEAQRRTEITPPMEIQAGEVVIEPDLITLPEGISINLSRDEVKRNGEMVNNLTRIEWSVLRLLAVNTGSVVPRDEIKTKTHIGSQDLRSYISTLRKKLEIHPKNGSIKTVKHLGYMLDDGRENPEDIITAGSGIAVNMRKRQVKKDEKLIPMTPIEYELLKLLSLHIGDVVLKKNILREIFFKDGVQASKALATTLCRIRNKLDVPARSGPIRSHVGIGVELLALKE
ncbi:MAG: winged helix-turn-helix domain-containing protein [Patescibacteria group bacterium]